VPLTIDIDGETAAELTQFRRRLEVTLILHVGLGKDHFIPVSANYGMFLCPTYPRSTISFLSPFFFLGGEVWTPESVCIERFTQTSIV
jgi:hypothetical protein